MRLEPASQPNILVGVVGWSLSLEEREVLSGFIFPDE